MTRKFKIIISLIISVFLTNIYGCTFTYNDTVTLLETSEIKIEGGSFLYGTYIVTKDITDSIENTIEEKYIAYDVVTYYNNEITTPISSINIYFKNIPTDYVVDKIYNLDNNEIVDFIKIENYYKISNCSLGRYILYLKERPVYYQIEVITELGGKISVDGNLYTNYCFKDLLYDDTILLSAVALDGYSFKGWYIDNILFSTEEAITYKVTRSEAIYALFEKNPQLTIEIDGPGKVYCNDNLFYGTTKLTNYKIGNKIILEALEVDDYDFIGWEYDGNIITDKKIEILIEKDITIKAIYKEYLKLKINLTQGGILYYNNEKIDHNLMKKISRNSSISLKIESLTGYRFKELYINKEKIEYENEYNFKITKDTNIEIIFEEIVTSLLIDTSNIQTIIKLGNKTFDFSNLIVYGVKISSKVELEKEEYIIDVSNIDYNKPGFYDVIVLYKENPKITNSFVVEIEKREDKYYKVQITTVNEEGTYAAFGEILDDNYENIIGLHTYKENDLISLKAINYFGYNFLGWYFTNNGKEIKLSSDMEYIYEVVENGTLEARFTKAIKKYIVIINGGYLMVENDSTRYEYKIVNENQKITVYANDKSIFPTDYWVSNNGDYIRKNTFTALINADITFTLKSFEDKSYSNTVSTVIASDCYKSGVKVVADELGNEKYVLTKKTVHQYKYQQLVNPTCEKEGTLLCTCINCGYKEYRKIEGGHAFSSYQIKVAATKNEIGIMERTCYKCGLKEEKEYINENLETLINNNEKITFIRYYDTTSILKNNKKTEEITNIDGNISIKIITCKNYLYDLTKLEIYYFLEKQLDKMGNLIGYNLYRKEILDDKLVYDWLYYKYTDMTNLEDILTLNCEIELFNATKEFVSSFNLQNTTRRKDLDDNDYTVYQVKNKLYYLDYNLVVKKQTYDDKESYSPSNENLVRKVVSQEKALNFENEFSDYKENKSNYAAIEYFIEGCQANLNSTSIYLKNTTINLNAKSLDGYIFDGWYIWNFLESDGYVLLSREESLNFTITQSCALLARATKDLEYYQVDIENGFLDNNSSLTSYRYQSGKVIRISAIVKEGLRLKYWEIKTKDKVDNDYYYQNSFYYIIYEDTIFTPVFEILSYTVTFKYINNIIGGTIPNNINNVEFGSIINLKATSLKDGYVFKGWYIYNGGNLNFGLINDTSSFTQITIEEQYNYIMPSKSVTIYAYYEQINPTWYEVTISGGYILRNNQTLFLNAISINNAIDNKIQIQPIKKKGFVKWIIKDEERTIEYYDFTLNIIVNNNIQIEAIYE